MMTTVNSLSEALLHELQQIYNAERQIIDALPKLIKKADSASLKAALQDHMEETENQIARLDRIGSIVGSKFNGNKCKGMQGLLEEGADLLEFESENPALIDILLACGAQKIEQYEMAAYDTAVSIAEELGLDEVVELLEETLDEEIAADQRFSEILAADLLPEVSEKSDALVSRAATKAQPIKS
ncbi:MAG: DUF892 family protein [Oligoflexia bacterium]|nr:DUF892 family protein [Oligoflexia bacterium]